MSQNNFQILTLNSPNITDFAKERNKLLTTAKKEWVLFLDTDETLTKSLNREIQKVLKQKDIDSYNGFYIYRKNYLLGKYSGTDKILRLGRIGKGEWKRTVHEVWSIEGKVGELKNPLIHSTAKTLNEFIKKIDYYSTLHAKQNLADGKKATLPKIIFYPILKFIESVLSGRNFVMSLMQSFHSFLAWSKQSLIGQNPGKQWKLQNV